MHTQDLFLSNTQTLPLNNLPLSIWLHQGSMLPRSTVAAPTVLKGKGKAIKALEPTDRRSNPSDVHIFSAEDSHSNSASP